MKKITKKQVVPFVVIIGTIIIPLLYSYFYLGAFWDPYSRLQDLPVAIVNSDTGATLNGNDKNFGQEMCDELKKSNDLKYVFTSEEDADKGTENKDYYACIKIPSDFSRVITSASTDSKQIAKIIYSPNEKRNFLASQILNRAVVEIESSLKDKINAEIISELSEKLNQTPDKLGTLSDGLNKLNDGATTLNTGASDLSKGSNSLLSGAKSLDGGINDLLNGIKQLDNSTANINDLKTGAEALSANAKLFNDSLTQYTAGVTKLITNVNSTSQFLATYYSTHASLQSDPVFTAFLTQLGSPDNKANLKALTDGTALLNSSSAQIKAGIDILSKGTGSIPQLKAGITQIKTGLETAKKGSTALSSGAVSLNDGMAKLNAGSSDLKAGTSDALSSVNGEIVTGKGELKSLDGLDTFATDHIKFEQQTINPVPNYGTAFAPYFLSLSLWVGALIIFVAIYMDADSKFKILSRASDRKILRSFCYLIIGIIQALVLGTVLIFSLGLDVKNTLLFFGVCCLISLVSISIVQFLMVFVGDFGKFLSLLLLILQLTSCGGTFPMQVVPKFFNILYPFMPMTYGVSLLKDSISGVSNSDTIFSASILFGLFIVFMTLTIIFSRIRRKKNEIAKATLEAISI